MLPKARSPVEPVHIWDTTSSKRPWHSFVEFDNYKRPSTECRMITNDRQVNGMSTKECRNARARGNWFTKGTIRDPRKRNLWYFGEKKRFNAPTRSPPPLLCRDPVVEMVAKIGHRVKISLQSPTFAPQRTYTVKDKRSTQSMGYEPSQPCLWTCIIDRSFFIYNPGIFL